MKVNATPPLFTGHTEREGGLLPNTNPAAHACWYYARLAMLSLERYDEGRALVDDPEIEIRLESLAWSVSDFYGLDNPGEFLAFIRLVKKEAQRCALPWDERIEDPKRLPIRRRKVYTDEAERETFNATNRWPNTKRD